ncbi:MAG TPA: hypothetical protein VGP24_03430, partial [Glaciihabitans sp.]|nr:hypothetical protein [Glaciihabitans sp.]
KAKILHRRLAITLLAVIVVVAGGVGAATWFAIDSQAKLLTAQNRTAELLAEQATYAEVRQVQSSIDVVTSARQVGTATEVDWEQYLADIRGVLPTNVTIDTVTVDSAAPFTLYVQPTVPLQLERVATITLGLTSPALPTVPAWLEGLRTLPGYADATPGSITRTDTGDYQVIVTLNINADAYANRFSDSDEAEESAADGTESADAETSATEGTEGTDSSTTEED